MLESPAALERLAEPAHAIPCDLFVLVQQASHVDRRFVQRALRSLTQESTPSREVSRAVSKTS